METYKRGHYNNTPCDYLYLVWSKIQNGGPKWRKMIFFFVNYLILIAAILDLTPNIHFFSLVTSIIIWGTVFPFQKCVLS